MKTETIEGNKLIAEFIDIPQRQLYSSPGIKEFYWRNPNTNDLVPVSYHSSWDWQIPAIKKFKALDIDNNIYRNHVLEIDSAVIDEYDITQSFAALVDGIKWYNQNK
jgi:hypothetical protein